MTIPWGELLRFGISGVTNTVLTYCVYAGLILLGCHYLLALAGDYCFAVAYSLIVNKFFTFRHKGSIGPSLVISMAATYLILFLLNWGLLFIVVDVEKWGPLPGQAIATVLVAGASFLLQRTMVFRKRESSEKH